MPKWNCSVFSGRAHYPASHYLAICTCPWPKNTLTFDTYAWARHFAVLTSEVPSLNSWRLLAALEACGSQSTGGVNCSGPAHSPDRNKGVWTAIREMWGMGLQEGWTIFQTQAFQQLSWFLRGAWSCTDCPLLIIQIYNLWSSSGGKDLVIERTLVLTCSYFPNMGKFSMSMRLGYAYF